MYVIDPNFILLAVLAIFLLIIGVLLIYENPTPTITIRHTNPVINNIQKQDGKLVIMGENFSLLNPQIIIPFQQKAKISGIRFKNKLTIDIPTNFMGKIPIYYSDGKTNSKTYFYKLTNDNQEYSYQINDNLLSFEFKNIIPDEIYCFSENFSDIFILKMNIPLDISKIYNKKLYVLIKKGKIYYSCKELQIP